MLLNTATVGIKQYNANRLWDEHQKNLSAIERIKQEIGQEVGDNENSVPLFEQLETGG